MGAGASASEGRVFCHHCGARTLRTGHGAEEPPECAACGATDGVEATDARLPVTSASSTPSLVGGLVGPSAVSRSAAAAPSSLGPMRVESVTVVTVQRPEDGGLLLRVLPNLVPRRAPPEGPDASLVVAPSAPEQEEAETPPEPACAAFVSRLQSSTAALPDGPDAVCVICADGLSELGTAVAKLSCGHAFHDACIREWLTRRHTCPTCRLELEVDDVKYLRSIGLDGEADEMERVQREEQAEELEREAAARRRWVDAMRRGDPVHFGLACGQCAVAPLIGNCFRCECCDGDRYFLCAECHAARKALVDAAREPKGAAPNAAHPLDHTFAPFGSAGVCIAGLPLGPSGALTVLVPAASRSQSDGEGSGAEAAPSGASLAAAEVALAAVRSLALAPLMGDVGSRMSATTSVGSPSIATSRLHHSVASRR